MLSFKNIARKIFYSLKRTKHSISLNFKTVEKKRLHLGCGNIRLNNFCNVDILVTPAVDVVSDISVLDNFDNNSAELIYACHVLEHFSHEQAVKVLTRWFDVLAPSGELRISVPDIDRIVKIYTKNWAHF